MSKDNRAVGFLAELRRRNVFRVGIAYLLFAWVLLQIADVLFPALTLPEWTTRLVAGLLILGLPLALFFAWAFELTPEGLKLEKEVPRHQSITRNTGRKLDRVLIAILALALALFAVDKFVWQSRGETSAADKPLAAVGDTSIAVLPFVNMSDDPANEYFSDGMTEELLNLLAKIPELRVIGRTSSFQFKNKNEDLRVIGQKLGVTNILEGSVRKSGNSVRVTAQLIDVDDGAHLWSDTFDRSLDDIFRVQDEIATSVVDTLKIELLGEQLPRRKAPADTAAYDLYLRGQYFYGRLNERDLTKAADYYRAALALDPDLAPAWSGLGATYSNQVLNGSLPPEEGHGMAENAWSTALAIDPDLADAHYRLGFSYMMYDWNWPAAEQAFQQTLAIEPNHAAALSGSALLATALGDNDRAIELQGRSLLIDPLRSASHHNSGFINYRAGRYQQAERGFRHALEMSGGAYSRGTYYLSLVLLAQGKTDAAYAEINNEISELWRLAGIAMIAHALGMEAESVAALAALEADYADTAAFVIASAHAFRGETEAAFPWLERAYEQHEPLVAWIKNDRLLLNLTSQPRYAAFLARLKLDSGGT